MRIAFTVYGTPVPQGRAKIAVVSGHAVAYDPKPSRDFKRDVKAVAQHHVPDRLLTGPLVAEIRVYRPIPKGFSKRKREAALRGQIRPTTKPDLKNYIAGLEDALEGVIFANDSQIVGYGDSGKWYGDPPRVQIEITELEEGRMGEELLAQIRRELDLNPRLKTLLYGEIVLHVQNGKLVFIELTEKRKPEKQA